MLVGLVQFSVQLCFLSGQMVVCGFFLCSRGVKQGDPLSPLLFRLANEVLSRGISKLVNNKKILHMASPQGYALPLIFYMLMTYYFSVGRIISLLEI